MGLEQRLAALRERHANLESEINLENNRPHPNDERIASLKRQKLRIKDEMERTNHHTDA